MSRFGNLEFDGQEHLGGAAARVERDADHWLSSAEDAFGRAEFDQALRQFSRVLEHDPASLPAWAGQVRALIELGEFREAKVWAEKALERFPTAPELLAGKAVALGRLGELDTAMAFSDASLEERGDTPYVWLARGDVLLARKERRADYCFERARLIAPENWLVDWLAGRIRHYYGQFAVALKAAQKAAMLEPGNAAVWVLCGQCEMELGFDGHARRSFQQALDLDPGCRIAGNLMSTLGNRGVVAAVASRWRQWFRA